MPELQRQSVGIVISPRVRLRLDSVPVKIDVIWGPAAKPGRPPQVHVLQADLLEKHDLEMSLTDGEVDGVTQSEIRIGPKQPSATAEYERSDPKDSLAPEEPEEPANPEPRSPITLHERLVTIATWNRLYYDDGPRDRLVSGAMGPLSQNLGDFDSATREASASRAGSQSSVRHSDHGRPIDQIWRTPSDSERGPRGMPGRLTVVLPTELRQTDFAVSVDNCKEARVLEATLESLTVPEGKAFLGVSVTSTSGTSIVLDNAALLRVSEAAGTWNVDVADGARVTIEGFRRSAALDAVVINGDLTYVRVIGAATLQHVTPQGREMLRGNYEGPGVNAKRNDLPGEPPPGGGFGMSY